MRYIDRRFLFPVMAATAWAQQPSPAAAEAEATLRARAEQFFQLQVDKKYRPAEAMVADDTKDAYYSGSKFNIKGFTIQKVELLDDNTHARVTMNAKVTLMMPGAPPVDFNSPSTTLWKIEDGKWVWYIDTTATVQSPFGELKQGHDAATPSSSNVAGRAPDISTLRASVKVDRNTIELTRDGPPQTVTVSNDLPGGVDLELRSNGIPGLSVRLEKKHLEAGEKTVVYLQAATGSEGAGVVSLIVSPIATRLDIQVKIN